MSKYKIQYKYSKDNKYWGSTIKVVEAESDLAAIFIIQSQYLYTQILKVSAC